MAPKVKAAVGVEKGKSATAVNKGRPETKAVPSVGKSSAHSGNKSTRKTASKSESKAASVAAKMPAMAEPGSEPARVRDDLPAVALAIPPAELDAANQAYFDKCLEKIGFVPNVLQAYALDMAKLNAFAGMYNDLMLAPSGLSKLEREMIAVVVSSINRCYYCLTAHGAAVRQLSGDPILGEQLVMNYRAARLDPRRRAMLDFATKLTERPHEVEEADRETLRQAGFSERDIWDIGAVVGFFNMSNRIASATDMRPNEEYHTQARTPKA